MKWSIIVHVLALLSCSITLTWSISLSRPGCEEKCGNVTIPFPFGIDSKCSANSSFTVICRNSTTPFLSSINMEVLSVSLLGTIVVKQHVSPMNCSAELSNGRLPLSLQGSPFTISSRYNTLAVLGCQNSVWLLANETTTIGGCIAMCDANSTETSCNGVNCCQTTLPPRLKELEYSYKTTEASNNNSSCGYVLPVDKIWLKDDYESFKGLVLDRESGSAPLVLEWEFLELKGYSGHLCTYSDDYCLSYPDYFGRRYPIDGLDCGNKHLQDYCSLYTTSYYCQSPSNRYLYSFSNYYNTMNAVYSTYDYASSIKYCSCPRGYEGNPYLGCIDIDECRSHGTQYSCESSLSCTNSKGDYTCEDEVSSIELV